MKRRAWTAKDVRSLKRLASKRTRAAKIARALRREPRGRRGKRPLVLDYPLKRVLQESDTLRKECCELERNGPVKTVLKGDRAVYTPTRSAFFGAATK
jgi:hypothetical protein